MVLLIVASDQKSLYVCAILEGIDQHHILLFNLRTCVCHCFYTKSYIVCVCTYSFFSHMDVQQELGQSSPFLCSISSWMVLQRSVYALNFP